MPRFISDSMSPLALEDANHQQRGIRFDGVRHQNFCGLPERRSFLRFFLPLGPSKVEQFIKSRTGAAQASIHEQRLGVGKVNRRREVRVHKDGRDRSATPEASPAKRRVMS